MDHNIACLFENTFGKLNARNDGLIKNMNDPRTQIDRDRFSLATTNTRFPSFLGQYLCFPNKWKDWALPAPISCSVWI